MKWFSVEISDENFKSIYIPEGVLHGFQSLVDNTVVVYKMTADFRSSHSMGVRWNDPILRIDWPISNPIISVRDLNLPYIDDNMVSDLSEIK